MKYRVTRHVDFDGESYDGNEHAGDPITFSDKHLKPGGARDQLVGLGAVVEVGATAASGEAKADEPKALAKMNKAELLAEAAKDSIETVSVDGKDVAVADLTNKQLLAAIEAKRAS